MIPLHTPVTVHTPIGYDFEATILGRMEVGEIRYLVALVPGSKPFWVPAAMVTAA